MGNDELTGRIGVMNWNKLLDGEAFVDGWRAARQDMLELLRVYPRARALAVCGARAYIEHNGRERRGYLAFLSTL